MSKLFLVDDYFEIQQATYLKRFSEIKRNILKKRSNGIFHVKIELEAYSKKSLENIKYRNVNFIHISS